LRDVINNYVIPSVIVYFLQQIDLSGFLYANYRILLDVLKAGVFRAIPYWKITGGWAVSWFIGSRPFELILYQFAVTSFFSIIPIVTAIFVFPALLNTIKRKVKREIIRPPYISFKEQQL